MTMRLVLVHGFDPRGIKVGGIETHVRQLLRRHPADMRVLLVGIDDFGDLELGRSHTLEFGGREIDFVPVLHVPGAQQTQAAAALRESVTLRFAAALVRHIPTLRRMVRGEAVAAEIERFEYAPIVRAMGCPFVLVSHNEGDPRIDKMDSILSRYWYVNSVTEWTAMRLASRVFGVTPKIRDRLAARYPSMASRIGVLTVSVDTQMFVPTPFDLSSGKLKIIYAGRLDEFKDPPLMFRVAGALHARLGGAFEFHYCGSADPTRFAEFAAIAPFTVRHGALTSEGIAAVMRECQMGILTSFWEGMPCFLLELLSSGRPFGGLRLPQFDQVIDVGVNGQMAERGATVEQSEAVVVAAVLRQWDDIVNGRVNPEQVHARIIPWSVDNQLGRLFSAHREVCRRGTAPVATSSHLSGRLST